MVAILILPTIVIPVIAVFHSGYSDVVNLPIEIILVMIFLGVFSLGLAHWFWLEGLSRAGAINAGVYLYFEPLVTTGTALIILGESLTIFLIIGAVLIISGVYLVERKASSTR